jgi:hypothetical protein
MLHGWKQLQDCRADCGELELQTQGLGELSPNGRGNVCRRPSFIGFGLTL